VRKTPLGGSSRMRRGRNRQWKLFAMILVICAGAALFGSMLLHANYVMIANFYLFGDSKPQIQSAREKELKKEFDGMIMKEFGGKK
jgi:hypothetical protein